MKRFKSVLKTILIMLGLGFVLHYLDYDALEDDVKSVRKSFRRWF